MADELLKDREIDRWGTNIPQWDSDFGPTFRGALLDHYFSEDALKYVDWLEAYIIGIRAGWTEEQKVAHVKSINELWRWSHNPMHDYQMEMVYLWLEKMATGDEVEWIRLINSICHINPRFKPEINVGTKLIEMSPFRGNVIRKYWCCSSFEPHIGADSFEGGIPVREILEDLGHRVPEMGATYLLLIPPEALKQIRVIQLPNKDRR